MNCLNRFKLNRDARGRAGTRKKAIKSLSSDDDGLVSPDTGKVCSVSNG